MKKNSADAIFIAQPENVCWTLNIRGDDLDHTPIVRSCLLIDKKRNITLFSDNISNTSIIKNSFQKINTKKMLRISRYKKHLNICY